MAKAKKSTKKEQTKSKKSSGKVGFPYKAEVVFVLSLLLQETTADAHLLHKMPPDLFHTSRHRSYITFCLERLDFWHFRPLFSRDI